jgi:hypothetical protein
LGWKCLSLDSKSGYEYKGVVDTLAVRRDKEDPDKLHAMLLQVKGGSARECVFQESHRLCRLAATLLCEEPRPMGHTGGWACNAAVKGKLKNGGRT